MSVTRPTIKGFDGFRVRRTVEGKVYQQYFSAAEEDKAHAYDEELALLQKQIKAAARLRVKLRQDSSKFPRHVSLIIRKWKRKDGTTQERPYYQVALAGEITKAFIIKDSKYKEAWRAALAYLAMLKRVEKEDLWKRFKVAPRVPNTKTKKFIKAP